jgi:hypothetical protein
LLKLLDLVLELLDVLLLALTECALIQLAVSEIEAAANILEQLGSVLHVCWSTVPSGPYALHRRRWGRLGSCSVVVSQQWLDRCAAEDRRNVLAVAG